MWFISKCAVPPVQGPNPLSIKKKAKKPQQQQQGSKGKAAEGGAAEGPKRKRLEGAQTEAPGGGQVSRGVGVRIVVLGTWAVNGRLGTSCWRVAHRSLHQWLPATHCAAHAAIQGRSGRSGFNCHHREMPV